MDKLERFAVRVEVALEAFEETIQDIILSTFDAIEYTFKLIIARISIISDDRAEKRDTNQGE